MNTELYERITQKKEFSQLPKKDVELAIEKFEKRNLNDYQMLKLTRQFLRKIYSSFSSRKLLSPKKEKSAEWHLMKHKSTKERINSYKEVYGRIFYGIKKCSIIDLGSGVNGFSYGFFKEVGLKNPKYIAVEAIGQLVESINSFFEKNKINGKAVHLSLLETDKIKELVESQPSPRIVLLLKTIDSLETAKRDYSKELIKCISPLCERIVVSFATRSLVKRKKFSVSRNWILNFIRENYEILDDFELNGERYIVFNTKKSL